MGRAKHLCDKECQQNYQAREERWRQERAEAAEKLAEVKRDRTNSVPRHN